jgi:hypothetical protein
MKMYEIFKGDGGQYQIKTVIEIGKYKLGKGGGGRKT